VGTGIEGVVAKDSGVTVVASRDGEVVDVDASRIVLKHDLVRECRGATIR
jgi:DNA-directed RNA polymerase subunit beta